MIATGRDRAYSAVNTAMVMTYWNIGKRIVEQEQSGENRAEYGMRLIAALSGDDEGIVGKIYALVVEPDELGDTDARPEKEGQDGEIAHSRAGVIALHMPGDAGTRLGGIEQIGDLVLFEADDFLLVQLGRGHFRRLIDRNEPLIEEVFEHGAHGGKFARLRPFVAGELLAAVGIVGKIGEEDLDIGIRDLFELFERDRARIVRHAAELLLAEKIEEDAQIVAIIEAGERARAVLDAAEKILAKIGELAEELPYLIEIVQIAFLIVIGILFRRVAHRRPSWVWAAREERGARYRAVRPPRSCNSCRARRSRRRGAPSCRVPTAQARIG